MTFPIPPNPTTWASGQVIRAPQLRADASNLAWVYTKRPIFMAQQVTLAQSIANATVTTIQLDTVNIDTWSGHATTTSPFFNCPFSGWYLCQGSLGWTNNGAQTGTYSAGIHPVQNGTATNLLNSTSVPVSNVTNDTVVTNTCCDLVQMIAGTGDQVAMIGSQTQGISNPLTGPSFFKCEWVALPTTTYLGAPAVLGTLVSSPPTPALWPPGSGTTITSPVSAGGTTINVASTQGMVITPTGGFLGLEYYNGNAVSSVAETVQITGIIGSAIGITATKYAHASGAYVSIPVSAPFLNGQVRNMVNFLAYPPIFRANNVGSGQSLPAQVFPAATAVTMENAAVDNFAGFGGAGSSTYTFPLSGVYFVYGQVAFNPAVAALHAGISIAGGTTQWGDSLRTGTTSLSLCPTVSKLVRATAGQTVQLMGCNGSSNPIVLENGGSFYCTLIVVWRGF